MPQALEAPSTIDVELRGGPKALREMLRNYKGPKRIFEVLIDGPAGTGKSRGIGEVLDELATDHKGIRILVIRKTRSSLAESFMQTFEDEVLPEGSAVCEGALRENRHSYKYPITGAEMVMAGLDQPTRHYSAQYTVIYIQEATEITLDEYERFYRMVRHFRPDMRFNLIVMDCNPGAETHFLNRLCNSGRITRFLSRHEDNPAYFDYDRETKAYSITEVGTAYIDQLDKLTGVRYRQLRKGEWCSAEGAVLEGFDRAVHVINRPLDADGNPSLKPLDLRWFFASKDWGFTAPGVLDVWGVDGEGRMYCVAEWYATGKTLDWWCEKACDADKEFNILTGVADPSRPDAIESFNRALAGSRGSAMSGIWRPADNRRATSGQGDLSGIDLIRQRLVVQPDGKPRIFWLADCLRSGRDPELVARFQPCSTVEELPGVVYLMVEDGRPNREHTDPACADHGFDSTRYAASHAEGREWGPPQIEPLKYGENTLGYLFDHETFEEN